MNLAGNVIKELTVQSMPKKTIYKSYVDLSSAKESSKSNDSIEKRL
jgi:hypothetical protein